MVAAGAHLYEADPVDDLVRSTSVGVDEVAAVCPGGLFVARRDLDATVSPAQQRAALRTGWGLSLPTILWLRIRIDQAGGWFPLVATVSGYVVAGADLLEVSIEGTRAEPESTLALKEPGAWFETFRGRRLPTGRGRPWRILGWNQHGIDRTWPTPVRAQP